MSIGICLKCPHRQRPCAGFCPCTIDGRDIIDHAKAGDCPKNYFSDPARMPKHVTVASPATPAGPDIPLAGDVVEKIAHAIGADRLAKFWEKRTGKPCGCSLRKAKLNRATERLLKWWGKRSG